MLNHSMSKKGVRLLTGLAALAVMAAGAPAQAQSAPGAAPLKPAVAAAARAPVAKSTAAKAGATSAVPSKPYFIEFRARYALSYGHTFLAHGRLNAQGEIVQSEVAGLHPAGDSPTPWMIGHVMPVKSETGPSDGDLEDQYISARYRIDLTEAEYRHYEKYIRNLQASSPVWHAVFYNCSAFISDVARVMGLRIPFSTLLMPQTFINTLRDLNTPRAPGAPDVMSPELIASSN